MDLLSPPLHAPRTCRPFAPRVTQATGEALALLPPHLQEGFHPCRKASVGSLALQLHSRQAIYPWGPPDMGSGPCPEPSALLPPPLVASEQDKARGGTACCREGAWHGPQPIVSQQPASGCGHKGVPQVGK